MRVLKMGQIGLEINEWQYFLRGLDLYMGKVDGDFGLKTHAATIKFQKEHGLMPDGVVGKKTYAKAVELGYGGADIIDTDIGEDFPPKPSFKPLIGNEAREKLFGKFEYQDVPSVNNPEKIIITDGWQDENIVKVKLPVLSKATNGKYTQMRFHKLCAHQLEGFFAEIGEKGLTGRILTYAGAYYPRYIRGSRKTLSNHSWGTAFDINVAWNGLGRTPALVGEKGCVRELVEIGHKWGFYWGGHFSRKDGMHFEIAKILPK